MITPHDLYCIFTLTELCILFYDSFRTTMICFDFFRVIIYSPTCQTVVSDPFLWYSGPAPVIAFEEESEGAVDEPQRLVEWQADDVM